MKTWFLTFGLINLVAAALTGGLGNLAVGSSLCLTGCLWTSTDEDDC